MKQRPWQNVKQKMICGVARKLGGGETLKTFFILSLLIFYCIKNEYLPDNSIFFDQNFIRVGFIYWIYKY